MISKSISRYRIVSKIASGGMGSVYLAQDTKLERSIALKVLPPDVAADPGVLARFRQEARALALDPDDPAILYNVACNLSGLGQIAEAIDCLERTVKVGAAYKDWMMNDTDLDPLREEERFKALVASLG